MAWLASRCLGNPQWIKMGWEYFSVYWFHEWHEQRLPTPYCFPLCSRNARPKKALVGRAQWKINQPPSLER